MQQNFAALFYAPLYAGLRRGDFTAAGLDIELTSGLIPIDAGEALAEGRLDLLWAGPIRVLRMLSHNPASPLRYLAEAVRRDPFLLVGRTLRPGFRIADLVSLRFATVSEVPTPWVCLAQDLRDTGLDPAALPRLPGAPMAANIARLRRGEADVIQVFEPFASELAQAGDGHVRHAAAMRGPTAYSGFVGPATLIERTPDVLPRLRRALQGALAFVRTAPPRDVAALLAGDFSALAPELVAAQVERYQRLDLWADDPRPDPAGLARLGAAVRAAGLIDAVPDTARIVA